MNRGFLRLAPALLFGAIALAQANPGARRPGPAPAGTPRTAGPESPVVHSDRTITFSLLAPSANSVSVNGQLYPAVKKGQQDGVPLVKDDKGVWSATIGPLPPEFYDYYFIVDGVHALDPQNQHVAYGANWLIVPGGATSDYLVNNVPHGTVSLVWYASPTLGMPRRRMTIYTPPGYEDSSARYPVLYLLHGGGASEHTWWESGRVPEVLDNLIAQGKAIPMVVVLPNGNETQTMTNAEADNPAPRGGGPAGQQAISQQLPDSVANDIIPYVDKHYRTRADREDRAIIGLSLGAGQAVVTAFQHLDDFAWAGVFSGEIAPIPELAPGAGSKLHPFYWSNSSEPGSESVAAGKKMLDHVGIKYVLDSRPMYGSEFWRSGLVPYVSQLFRPEQSHQ